MKILLLWLFTVACGFPVATSLAQASSAANRSLPEERADSLVGGSGARLIEAESFANLGGWVIDQQSMDEMGSPYLLAHGLGEPVADATTVVKFERRGKYRLWVRTRDWVAPWKTPETHPDMRAEGSPGMTSWWLAAGTTPSKGILRSF